MSNQTPNLHRALLLSLPGAALLSLPVGVWLYETQLRRLGFPAIMNNTLRDALVVLLFLLGPAAAWGGMAAIRETAKSDSWPLVRVLLMVFNLLAVCAGAFALVMLVAVFFIGFD